MCLSTNYGQSNPFYPESSMLWSVYSGEMTQFNIFSWAMTPEEVSQLASGKTCNNTLGDIISWTDVIPFTMGDLVLRERSQCLDINECWFPQEFPCGMRRACVDLPGSYDCSTCLYGYTGPTCQDPVDECAMDVCRRGTCVDGPDPYDFWCICPPGFTGLYCEVMLDLCLSSPCQNGGHCLPQANSFTCTCPLPHMGPLCEKPTSACFPNPCLNQGVCIERSQDSFECSCSDNFQGSVCEKHIDWCEQHPCFNAGICQNQSSTVKAQTAFSPRKESICICQPGWIGMNCDVQIVFSCELSPCLNGGTCLPSPGKEAGYTCLCPSGPEGEYNHNCEYLNPCSSSPCNHDSVCVRLPNYTYICICAGGMMCHHGSDEDALTVNITDNSVTASLRIEQLSAKMLAVAIVTPVLLILLAAVFVGCFFWRKHKHRSQDDILSNAADVTGADHLINLGFQSEELQLEESIYAELGDGYEVPTEEFLSAQSSVKSETLQLTGSRSTLASSSGSRVSLNSTLTKRGTTVDATNQPLLYEDYLEPLSMNSGTVRDSLVLDYSDNKMNSLTAAVTNLGFDKEEKFDSQVFNQEGTNTRKEAIDQCPWETCVNQYLNQSLIEHPHAPTALQKPEKDKTWPLDVPMRSSNNQFVKARDYENIKSLQVSARDKDKMIHDNKTTTNCERGYVPFNKPQKQNSTNISGSLEEKRQNPKQQQAISILPELSRPTGKKINIGTNLTLVSKNQAEMAYAQAAILNVNKDITNNQVHSPSRSDPRSSVSLDSHAGPDASHLDHLYKAQMLHSNFMPNFTGPIERKLTVGEQQSLLCDKENAPTPLHDLSLPKPSSSTTLPLSNPMPSLLALNPSRSDSTSCYQNMLAYQSVKHVAPGMQSSNDSPVPSLTLDSQPSPTVGADPKVTETSEFCISSNEDNPSGSIVLEDFSPRHMKLKDTMGTKINKAQKKKDAVVLDNFLAKLRGRRH